MSNKYDDAPPPSYPPPTHQDAGPYPQPTPSPAPGHGTEYYGSPAPRDPNQLQPYPQQSYQQQQGYGGYGPPQQGYYPPNQQQGYYGPQQQGGGMYYAPQQQPQGYYGNQRPGGGGASQGLCAGLLGATACCCCLDFCLF